MNEVQTQFSRVYAEDLWAGGSGTGSVPENNLDYVLFLQRFMRLNEIRSVVDFGCGDWQFSRLIDWTNIDYTGIDVVSTVIDRNTELFSSKNIRFMHSVDINDTPGADLLICKDVFQHLPNSIIMDCVNTLKNRYKFMLITNDDYPLDNLNGDIGPGQWRALRLDQPPFSLNCISLLSWTVISKTPTVRKRTLLLRGESGEASGAIRPTLVAQKFIEIPRRIFQTWKVRSPLPSDFECWSDTIKRYNPDYDHVIWDDKDNRDFILQNYAWFTEKYDSYEKEIMRVDAVRYFELFHHGGFYMDLDVECMKGLDEYLVVGDVVLGQMGSDPSFAHSIPNAIMASKPRQEFWLYVMSRLLDGPSSGYAEYATGPAFLKSCVDGWNQSATGRQSRVESVRRLLSPDLAMTDETRKITILPPNDWYPLDWNDPIHQLFRLKLLDAGRLSEDEKQRFFGRSTLVTYWSHSWESQPISYLPTHLVDEI